MNLKVFVYNKLPAIRKATKGIKAFMDRAKTKLKGKPKPMVYETVTATKPAKKDIVPNKKPGSKRGYSHKHNSPWRPAKASMAPSEWRRLHMGKNLKTAPIKPARKGGAS